MNQAKNRLKAIALVPIAALILAADLAQPGWGRFPNPVFYTRFVANGLKDKFSKADEVSIEDARLANCKTDAAPVTITDAQAAVRKTLVGQSSVIAVQMLGTPACELANGSYRWLLESGLSLDASIADSGNITEVKLSR